LIIIFKISCQSFQVLQVSYIASDLSKRKRLKKRLSEIRKILTASERRKFVSLIFLNTLLSLVDIASIALVFVVLNIYSGKPASWLFPLLQKLNIQQQSLTPAIILVTAFIIKSLIGYLIIKAQARFMLDIATRLAGKNLLLYLEGSYEDYVNTDSAVLIRRISFQALEFAQYVLFSIQQIINEIILIIITVTALALYNIKLLAIVSLVLLPAVIILSYITKKRLRETRKNLKSANELALQYLNESISGFVESNIYHKNKFFIQRFIKSQFTSNRFIADMQVTQTMPARFFETFAVIGLFIFITVIKFSNTENSAGILTLGAFIAAAYKVIPGISKIINYLSQVKTYLFTADELAKKSGKKILQHQSSFQDEIENMELKNVSFSYGNHIVLNNFNCCIHKNSFIGISGESGKGKTTLIDILLGFLSPQSGKIFFNNQEVHSAEIKKFWQQFAYVKQTTFLLHDSILNNIILYERDFDEKKLNDILNITGIANWVKELKDGIHTIITENGKNISGGQRQRIAIARALFKNAPVIILDEPFNELDEASELSMLHYFKQSAQKGKIIMLITHNMQSLSFCDAVITLAD
jgi:ABC-type multidrug transport system fused ATPase/permease subunit